MPNTGYVITTTLKDVIPPCPGNCTPLGDTKPNIEGDPDYIPRELDTSLCAVSYTMTCPSFVATGLTGEISYELSILKSVTLNPSIKGIRIEAVHSVSGIENTTDYDFPLDYLNYLLISVSVPPGTYTLNGYYYDASDSVIQTCNSLATGIVVS